MIFAYLDSNSIWFNYTIGLCLKHFDGGVIIHVFYKRNHFLERALLEIITYDIFVLAFAYFKISFELRFHLQDLWQEQNYPAALDVILSIEYFVNVDQVVFIHGNSGLPHLTLCVVQRGLFLMMLKLFI